MRIAALAGPASMLAGALAFPAVAVARGDAAQVPAMLAFLGIDVGGLVHKVVGFFFETLLDGLVPGFLKRAGVDALRWLVAVPNPANRQLWPTVGELQRDLTAVGVGLLPLTFTLAATRYWALGLTGADAHAARALVQCAGAVCALVAYQWAFANTVAGVNVVTHAILGFDAVERGLGRSAALLFSGSLLSGSGIFLALLGIVAAVLAIGLFLLKVALLVVCAILYASGGLLIALSPLPEAHGLFRAWKFGLVTIAAIPVGWCVIFAVSGALALDVTTFGASEHVLDRETVGVFAAIITFLVALRWPFWLFGAMRARLGATRSPTARTVSTGAPTSRVQLARATLRGGKLVNTAARSAYAATPLAASVPAAALRGGVAGLGARAGGSAGDWVAAKSVNPSVQAAAGHVRRVTAAAGQHAGAAAQAGRDAIIGGSSPTGVAAGAVRASRNPGAGRPATKRGRRASSRGSATPLDVTPFPSSPRPAPVPSAPRAVVAATGGVRRKSRRNRTEREKG